MSITNRIAARVLGAIVSRLPERPEAGTGRRVEDAPLVWRYTIADRDTGEAYMTRVVFPRIPLLQVRPLLHHIHRPDYARSLHNHPWRWSLSVILAGSYVEDRMAGQHRVRRTVRLWNWIRDRDYHAIRECRGEVFTLFFSGPRSGEGWGFLVGDQHVPHADYDLLRRLPELRGAGLDAAGALLGIERCATYQHGCVVQRWEHQQHENGFSRRLVKHEVPSRVVPEPDVDYRLRLCARRRPGEEVPRPVK